MLSMTLACFIVMSALRDVQGLAFAMRCLRPHGRMCMSVIVRLSMSVSSLLRAPCVHRVASVLQYAVFGLFRDCTCTYHVLDPAAPCCPPTPLFTLPRSTVARGLDPQDPRDRCGHEGGRCVHSAATMASC